MNGFWRPVPTGAPPAPLPGRIAMLSVHTCPLATLGGKKTGGMNVYVRDFSRELGRRGIQVDVFTRSQDNCQPRVKHDLGYGGRVIHIPAGPEIPLPVSDVEQYLDEFVAGVLAFAEREGYQYNLIHSHYWLSGLVAKELRAAWGWDIPIVQMFHTLGHMKNRIASSLEHHAPQRRIAGETRVIHDIADTIIAATPAEKAQLKWLYQADLDRVTVIPPGVDLDRFQPLPQAAAKQRLGLPQAPKNVVFAGRIEPLKGIDTLLEAIALLQGCCPQTIDNLTVTIVGGDPWADEPDAEMARLKGLREELGLEELVTFVGSKDQDALPDYYAAAEMVIMPSHYESFGLVALEAMAMGTPVIASEVGGLAFLIQDGHTGFHVPSRDPAALADKMDFLLKNKACRDGMGAKARRHAAQFAWPLIVDEMMALYAELLRPQLAPVG